MCVFSGRKKEERREGGRGEGKGGEWKEWEEREGEEGRGEEGRGEETEKNLKTVLDLIYSISWNKIYLVMENYSSQHS